MNRKKIYKMLTRLGIILLIVGNLMGNVSTKACFSDDVIDQIIKSNDQYGANANEYIDKMVKNIIRSKESHMKYKLKNRSKKITSYYRKVYSIWRNQYVNRKG